MNNHNERRTELTGHKGELTANNAIRRLAKLGYQPDGGYSSLDRGWVRVKQANKYFQCHWNINNDGIINLTVIFGKVS